MKFSPTVAGPQQGYVELRNAQGTVIAQILVRGNGYSAAVPVPGLREWAQVLLSALLAVGAVLAFRRKV